MIVTFRTPTGGKVAVNPALVLAVEPQGQGGERALIIMGHSYSYVVDRPFDEVVSKLDF